MKITAVTRPIKLKSVNREWHLVDVKDQILGRVAGKIARLLQGKHKLNYVPYLDFGDYVVVINARYIKLTGKKEKTKTYQRYSGYPGGLRVIPYLKLKNSQPEAIIKHAVSGMLPKNKLRARRMARLFVYPKENHPYQEKLTTKSEDKSAKNKD